MLKRTRSVKAVLLLALSAVIIMLLCSCKEANKNVPSEKAAYYSFTDDAGEKITLAEKPEKVAVLFSSFADVWQSAGGKVDITVGESVERGFAKDAVLVDGGAGKTINTELLLDSEPDFVICTADLPYQAEVSEMLNSAGIPCARFHVDTFDEYLNMLKICTDITGDKKAYETNGTAVQERINSLLGALDSEPVYKNILFIRAGSGSSSVKAKTADDNFAAAMLEKLGTYNIAKNAPVLLDGLSTEEIVSASPDFIFISIMGDENAAKAYMDSVLSERAFQSLTAVQKGNVVYLPKDLFQYKPNKNWDKAYEYLINIIYEK